MSIKTGGPLARAGGVGGQRCADADLLASANVPIAVPAANARRVKLALNHPASRMDLLPRSSRADVKRKAASRIAATRGRRVGDGDLARQQRDQLHLRPQLEMQVEQ